LIRVLPKQRSRGCHVVATAGKRANAGLPAGPPLAKMGRSWSRTTWLPDNRHSFDSPS